MNDYGTLSTSLRRLHNKWWEEMNNKNYCAAAFTANDIEALGRVIASVTHKIYHEETK